MKGFLLGLLVAGLGFGGYLYWKELRAPKTKTTVAARDAGVPVAKKKRKRTRGAIRLARAPGPGEPASEPAPEPEPEPVRLSPADLKMVGQGDDLSRPDLLRLDMGDDKEIRELTQDDIDASFRPQEPAILDCISAARPDPETYVPGRVTIKFRIQRAGTVRGVRVDAPAILHKGGLYGCIKNVVGRLRFSSSGSSQVVSYPFTLS